MRFMAYPPVALTARAAFLPELNGFHSQKPQQNDNQKQKTFRRIEPCFYGDKFSNSHFLWPHQLTFQGFHSSYMNAILGCRTVVHHAYAHHGEMMVVLIDVHADKTLASCRMRPLI